jgi:hypothetical protein
MFSELKHWTDRAVGGCLVSENIGLIGPVEDVQ